MKDAQYANMETAARDEEDSDSSTSANARDNLDTVRMDVDVARSQEKMKEAEGRKDLERGTSCEACDFETAITATGYGKYNLLLMTVSFIGLQSCIFATSTMSLILPSAGCDLKLSNVDKGVLNAATYVGMIISAFIWGFLSDTLGRKKLLVIGFACEGVCATVVGLAQDFSLLLVAKLCSGFVSSGPYVILMTYLAESHAAKYRPSIILWTGIFGAAGTVGLPALAWLIIPQPDIQLRFGPLWLPSWRIFLLIATIPSFCATCLISLFAESPKFLMSQGRREEALKVFQNIYAVNTGQPKDTFPIKSLVDELKAKECEEPPGHGLLHFFKAGWAQIHPLFLQPHLPYAALVFLIQFGSLFGLNTIRLWTPQLFSSMLENEKHANGFVFSSVCELLDRSSNLTNLSSLETEELELEEELECSESVLEDRVYINTMIIGVATGVGYLTSGYMIRAMGNKWLMVVSYLVGGACIMSMFWATSSDTMLIINSIYNSVLSVASTAIVTVVVDLFPTGLRTMAISLTMMFGRVGAMTGNVVFPILLDWNCAVPFFLLGTVVLATGALTLLLPKTKGKPLQ